MIERAACQQFGVFLLVFLITNFINKYVLSVLEFKYPTIFQGWQTLVGFFVIRMAVFTQKLPTMISDESSKKAAVRWIPGMIFFAVQVYSGSKALANLSVPVFFSLQNLTIILSCTIQVAITRKLLSLYSYVMLMIIVASSVVVVKTDPQFQADGYFWMIVHIFSLGGQNVFTHLTRGRYKLSSYEKLYCNYIYCIIVFIPCSYLLGDAIEARKFPYLYFSKFYLGCLISGVFGALTNILSIKLQEESKHFLDFRYIIGFSKIVCSLLSVEVFEDTFTPSHSISLTVNHLCSLVCEDPLAQEHRNLVLPSYKEAKVKQQSVINDTNEQDSSSMEVVKYTIDIDKNVQQSSSKQKTSHQSGFPTRSNVLYTDFLSNNT